MLKTVVFPQKLEKKAQVCILLTEGYGMAFALKMFENKNVAF